MSNPQLTKNYSAGAAIAPFAIVRFSAAETVVTASAATDALIGVTSDVGPASGERVDVIMEGITYCVAGAAVAQGALLTSDASGRAVTAAPAVGVNNRTIGFAVEAAVAAGDVIRIMLSPGSVQG